MAVKFRVLALSVVIAGLLPNSGSSADQEAVTIAIERGVIYLKGLQQANGSWDHDGHSVGATALAGLTLLECDVEKTDPIIQKAAQFVRQGSISLGYTYSISLAILFLDRTAEFQNIISDPKG